MYLRIFVFNVYAARTYVHLLVFTCIYVYLHVLTCIYMYLLCLPSPQGAEGALRTPARARSARKRALHQHANTDTSLLGYAVPKALEDKLDRVLQML